MQNQHYKNHRRFVPLYHFVFNIIIVACIVVSVRKLIWAIHIHHGRLIAATLLGLSIGLLLLGLLARSFALRAQDRAIRAEENLRHFALTGKLLDSRLRLSQVIALRFASDTEFIILSERAAKDNLNAAEIKKQIVNWRGDYHRA